MGTGPVLLGAVILPLLVFVLMGGPMVLADWQRRRRQETIMRQVAITDAIDAELGAIVAPVVRKPLWGPWRIQIAVPFSRPGTVGRILALAHEVLSLADRMNPGRYEIVLTGKPDAARENRQPRVSKPAAEWAQKARLAA